ncbi:hypothetical protein TWF281_010821 [Arthrobotrys megalospora]
MHKFPTPDRLRTNGSLWLPDSNTLPPRARSQRSYRLTEQQGIPMQCSDGLLAALPVYFMIGSMGP